MGLSIILLLGPNLLSSKICKQKLQGRQEDDSSQHPERVPEEAGPSAQRLLKQREPGEHVLKAWAQLYKAVAKLFKLRAKAASLMQATKLYSSLRQSSASRPSQGRKAVLKAMGQQ